MYGRYFYRCRPAELVAAALLGSKGGAEGFNLHLGVFVCNIDVFRIAAIAVYMVDAACNSAAYTVNAALILVCVVHKNTSKTDFASSLCLC